MSEPSIFRLAQLQRFAWEFRCILMGMKWGRIVFIVLGAVVLTSLGVGASDTLQGRGRSLLGQLMGSQTSEGVCPAGMIAVPAALTFTCVDIYEVSASDTCISPDPANEAESVSNIADADCQGESVVGKIPWRFVTRAEATAICTKAGKRLPNAAEWYAVSVGTEVAKCHVSGAVQKAGNAASCSSAAGIHDAIGNVWEWVSDDVFDGVYNGRTLPAEGFVAQADNAGVAAVTTVKHSASTTEGYFWSNPVGAFGMIRGGFYGSQSDAGMYAIQAATSPNFSGAAIGFRCIL